MMTNKEFCARLRKAKKLAVRGCHSPFCIYDACNAVGLILGRNAIFDKGGAWQNLSKSWAKVAKSPAAIAEIFNASIRALGEEP